MFTFGFSYIGMLYLIMLFVPNIIWIKKKPLNYEQYQKKESKVLAVFEKIGEIAVCCSVLIFSNFNIRNSYWMIWLIISFGLMLLYEMYWVRYFKSERKMSDFYRRFCGIPVAGATLPVCAFFLLGIYGSNILLIISTIILGIGHIGIHRKHYKEISDCDQNQILVVRILKWCGLCILSIFFVVIVFIIGCRNFNYLQHYVNIQNGVDEGIYISLSGQEQYVLLRGEDTQNPIIIYLHGGPSSPDTFSTYGFTDYLMDDYTVVAWDQRGCGRTYFRNRNSDPHNIKASFEQAKKDLDALVDYACSRFGKEKVIIMGHSYGTILGSQYASEHPDKISAYIGVAQVLSLEESTLFSYEDALAKAEAVGDSTKELELNFEQYQADCSLTNLLSVRSKITPYHPVEVSDQSMWMAITSPYFGMDDARWFLTQLEDFDEYYKLNQKLFDYIGEFDMKEVDLNDSFPVYFISGSDDWICPVTQIEEFVDGIDTKEKDFKMMDGCGHYVQYSQPEEFSNIVKQVLDYGRN